MSNTISPQDLATAQSINAADPQLQAMLAQQPGILNNYAALQGNVVPGGVTSGLSNFDLYGMGNTGSADISSAIDTSGGGLGLSAAQLSGAGGLLGGIAGLGLSNQAGGQANAAYQNALSNYNNILSEAQKQNFQVQLQQAQLANYNPAVLQAGVQLAPNAAANLGPNADVMAQQQANNQMLRGVTQSGYTPEMMSAYNQMLQQNNANAQAQIKGAQQAAAARGMGASGQALQASAGAASQAGLNAANTAAGNIAAQGFQNKLAAMGQLGSLTNAQQAQLSSLAAQQAAMTNQYGLAGTTLNADIAARNVAAQNRQQELQTGAQQQNYNLNTQIANQQAYQNQVNAQQQAINAQQAAASGAANAYGNVAANQKGTAGNVLGSIAQIGASILPFL